MILDRENMVDYLFEVGYLKQQQRTGMWRMGVRYPESVAEHSHRAAIIGFLLASLEGDVNPERVALICLFHDVPETRTGDLNWMNKRYTIDVKQGEKKALHEQVAQLPETIAQKILALAEEYNTRSSREGEIAHEADLIECMLECLEYKMQGYEKAQEWAEMCYVGLKTETAKGLAKQCLDADPGSWFQNLQDNPHEQKQKEKENTTEVTAGS